MQTPTLGSSCLTFCVNAMPSILGMLMSVSSTSGSVSRTTRSAISPSAARPTTSMSSSRASRRANASRVSRSSSATTTRIFSMPAAPVTMTLWESSLLSSHSFHLPLLYQYTALQKFGPLKRRPLETPTRTSLGALPHARSPLRGLKLSGFFLPVSLNRLEGRGTTWQLQSPQGTLCLCCRSFNGLLLYARLRERIAANPAYLLKGQPEKKRK